MKILKILAIILIILLLIVLIGFTLLYFNGLSGVAQTSEAKPGQIKVAYVGDSITC